VIKVVQYGVGAIGREIVKLLLKRDLEIVGAIDIDKEIIGKDLGEVVGLEEIGVAISDNPQEVLSQQADVVLHSTGSRLKDIYPQIVEVLESGSNLISTCEELAYPYHQHSDLAQRIEERAVKHGVTVLGTGVNPGFIMDLLPLVTTGVCQDVRSIKVKRVVDARKRRRPLQAKIGVGLTLKEFEERVEKACARLLGRGGHVGLIESIAMIGDGMGWRLDEISQDIEPVIADSPMESDFFKVEKGEVIGIRQVGYGIKDGKSIITLTLHMYLGADSHDRIWIEGVPSLNLSIEGGVHGDIATPAVAVNSIPQVLGAEPGLKTMKDLPPPSAKMHR